MKTLRSLPIDQIMQKKVISVSSEDTLNMVDDMFNLLKIHHLPVIGKNKKLVGIISSSDLDKIKWGKSLFVNQKKEELDSALLRTYRAADIMTKVVFTMQGDQTVEEAINKFEEAHFRAIPVVERGEILGILCPLDIMRSILTFSNT